MKVHEAKRQEHIYEFIITEKHHCQLLKVTSFSSGLSVIHPNRCHHHDSLQVIQRVFCEGMTQHLDMRPEILDRLFPQVCKKQRDDSQDKEIVKKSLLSWTP